MIHCDNTARYLAILIYNFLIGLLDTQDLKTVNCSIKRVREIPALTVTRKNSFHSDHSDVVDDLRHVHIESGKK